MLLVITIAVLVAVVALALSCVALTMFVINKSDDKFDDQEKRIQTLEELLENIRKNGTGGVNETDRLDDHEKRLDMLEQQLRMQEIPEIHAVGAIQISTHTSNSGIKLAAELALDGNEDTYMHTESHTNPWWCANMGEIYHAKKIIITNIRQGSDGTRARSSNLRVGLTNTRPVVGQSLAFDAYTLCEYNTGLMGPVGIVTCPNGVSGQYVVVQFVVNDYMHIAEVKIYGYKDQL